MADEARRRKVADRIKTTVAEMITMRKIKDPRMGFVTITDVRVTGDLQHATIFYTVLGEEKEQAGTQAAFHSARGLIRSTVGKALGIRLTPSLEFVPDALPQTAASFEETLAAAKAHDEEVARLAAQARYAGEANPYRRPEEEEEEEEADFDDSESDAPPANSGESNPVESGMV